jgi:D-3-phosphoglycerate dehydrogenase / 2-oxoglutarate reductase
MGRTLTGPRASLPARILVADSFAPEGLEVLRARADVDVQRGLDEEGLARTLAAGRYDALIVRSESRVTSAVLGASPRLRVVARAGVGVDNIDVEAATRHGVLVLNMPTGNTITTAEHTIALLCALVRHVPQANAALRAGRWERTPFIGVELAGKTLGIVGLGRVGAEVARRALGLALHVVAYDPYIAPEVADRLRVALRPTLDDVLTQSDILTLHTSLADETRGLIDARALALLPPGAYVINCARGGIVDEEALLAALESGHIAGAALDVFVDEPVREPHHPLISHPRVVATPHLGAATREAQLRVALGTAHEVLAALAGEPVQTAVNAPVAPQGMAETLIPYVALAHTLGQLAVQWDRGPLTALRVGVSGDLAGLETEPLVASALAGIFSTVTAERVNLVNARLVAEERGLQIEELRSSTVPEEGYRGALHVRLQRDSAHWVDLAGAVVHGQAHLLSINGYRLDLPLSSGQWLVTRHHDRPGIIGAVGQLLGDATINIGFMQLGRDEPHGMALMVVGVDAPVPDDVFAHVKALAPIESARRVRID